MYQVLSMFNTFLASSDAKRQICLKSDTVTTNCSSFYMWHTTVQMYMKKKVKYVSQMIQAVLG